MRTARTIKRNGVELATEAFGEPSDTPVLLIMGAMASMLWWADGFCEQLAARGRYVIRYDNRDTGLSTKYEPGSPSYLIDDMADDAMAVLDAYDRSSVHLVGMSLGGAIAQIAALKYPERIISLTVMSTWPVGMDTSHLPGMSEAYLEHAAQGETVDWSDKQQAVDFVVKDMRAIAGTRHPHDGHKARAFVQADADRSSGYLSATNHFMLKASDAWNGRTSKIAPPLLVMHGTADPLVPVDHGEALAGAVVGSHLVRIDGGGHEIHEMDWPQYLDEIARQTDR